MKLSIKKQAFAAFAASTLLFAVETKTWIQGESTEFEKGNLKGLALSSAGRLTLAPAFREVHDAAVPQLWSAAAGTQGTLYAGGAEGKVFAVGVKGDARLLATLDGGTVQSLAVDAKGGLFAATVPDAKVYAIAGDGTARVLAALKAQYVWGLVFDKAGTLYAATGEPGQVVKIAPDGNVSVVFDANEAHVRSLAVDTQGNLIAGTEPSGVIIRISPKGEGFVLYQAAKREVTAIAVAKDGTIYAAASGTRGAAAPPPATVPPPAPVTTAQAQTTSAQPQPQQPQPAPAGTARVTTSIPPTLALRPATVAGGSEIYRIAPDGEPRRIWSDQRDLVYALAFDTDGRLIAGTGNQGEIYRIDSELESTRLVTAEPMQVTALVPAQNGGIYAVTANPGMIYRLGPETQRGGTIESDLLDAAAFTYWGKLRWEGESRGGSIAVETRSGNLDNPDRNWSSWAPIDPSKGGRVASPPARFLGWRATLKAAPDGTSPVLSLVEVAYQGKNVPPVIEKMEITPANYKFPASSTGSTAASTVPLGPIGQVRRSSPSAPNVDSAGAVTLTFEKGSIGARWQASDQNGDTLTYRVEIRNTEDKGWMLLKDRLSENRVTIDSTRYADGRYLLRVTASDEVDNYPGLALTAQLESQPFVIDNTAPRIEGLTASLEGGKVRLKFRGIDDSTPLLSAQYSANGGDWAYARPSTGITDSLAHDYEAVFDRPAGDGVVIAVKLSDENDNVTVHKTVLRQ